MYILKATIDEVLATAQIHDIVATFESLKKQGRHYYVDGNKSLIVTPSKDIYKDFATGNGGGVVAYLQKEKDMGFREAIEYIAKYYNISVQYQERSEEYDAKLKEQEALGVVMETARRHFYDNLLQPAAQLYLAERGISKESCEIFGLGFAPSHGNALLEHATQYHSLEQLKSLFLVGEKEGRHYDLFRNRITFALHSRRGEVLGFAGRSIEPSPKIKYINPSDTPLYAKSKFIYGLYQAQASIKRAGHAYIVEGYLDVIHFHQLEKCNTVALSGLAISDTQINTLKRLTDSLVLCFDGDKAGAKATTRLLEELLRAGFDVAVVRLPNEHDPASFCQTLLKEKQNNEEQAREALDKYLTANKQNFVQYLVRTYEESITDTAVVKEMEALQIELASIDTSLVEKDIETEQIKQAIDALKIELSSVDDKEDKINLKNQIREVSIKQSDLNISIKKMKQEQKEKTAALKDAKTRLYKPEDAKTRAEAAKQIADLLLTVKSPIMFDKLKDDACKAFDELKKFAWKREKSKYDENHKGEEEDEEEEVYSDVARLRRYFERNIELRISTIDNLVQGKLVTPKFKTRIDSLKELNQEYFIPVDETAIQVDLSEKGYKIPEKDLLAFLKVGVPKFNIFQDYFEGLTCDGDFGYFNAFYDSLDLLPNDRKRLASLFPNWLARVVACAIDDTFYNKQCLVWQGEQHIGKSSLCNFFVPPTLTSYVTSYVDFANKDGQIAVCQNLFVSLEELDKYPAKDVAAMKAYMAMPYAKVRPPFERKAVSTPRRTSFVGNCNDTNFLKDTNGGSVRWLCFPLQGRMKWHLFNKLDINRMYALAYLKYSQAVAAGSWSSIEMTAEQIAENNEVNRQFTEYTEEMYYLNLMYRPVPKDLITDDLVASGEVMFFNSTALCEEIRAAYFAQTKRELRLRTNKMGEALSFFGYVRDKFKCYTHSDLYTYAVTRAPADGEHKGFYEGA